MTDTVKPETRSRMMASVRAKNTKLELAFRRRLFALGYRFRLHQRQLPGTPDLSFPRYKAVIFINGCFWHYHGCHLSKLPGTRTLWWKEKLETNRKRDQAAGNQLRKQGWRVLTIWECSFRRPGICRETALDSLAARAAIFLTSNTGYLSIPPRPTSGAPSARVKGKLQ